MKQVQYSKQHTVEVLSFEIGFWNLFDVCHLRFVIDKNYLLYMWMKLVDALKRKLFYIIASLDILDLMKIKNKPALLLLLET